MQSLDRFLSHRWCRKLLLLLKVLRVFELASGTIGAVELLMETLAELGLVVFGHVWLSVKLVEAMSKGAAVFKDAVAFELPVLAKLSLIFGSEIQRRYSGSSLISIDATFIVVIALRNLRLALLLQIVGLIKESSCLSTHSMIRQRLH